MRPGHPGQLYKMRIPPRLWFHGNPRERANWTDEGLNIVLRNVAQHVHSSTFHVRVQQSFNIIGILKLNEHIYGCEDSDDWF